MDCRRYSLKQLHQTLVRPLFGTPYPTNSQQFVDPDYALYPTLESMHQLAKGRSSKHVQVLPDLRMCLSP